ncbi:hypothetical protein MHK_008942, partial [Candidatus Magnetomorum sp. HK-1]
MLSIDYQTITMNIVEEKVKLKIYVIIWIFLLTNWVSINAAPITSEIAEKVAVQWFSSALLRQHKSLPIVKSITRIEKAYVCKLENGFVIVSSDDQFNPIIGYSDTNTILQVPPALRSWLRQYNNSNMNTLKR